MDIVNALKRLRDDLKTWVANNMKALDAKVNVKVNMVDGKGLSTNDFTNAYKAQLDELDNKGYQTQEQVQTLIDTAIANIPVYTGEVEDV